MDLSFTHLFIESSERWYNICLVVSFILIIVGVGVFISYFRGYCDHEDKEWKGAFVVVALLIGVCGVGISVAARPPTPLSCQVGVAPCGENIYYVDVRLNYPSCVFEVVKIEGGQLWGNFNTAPLKVGVKQKFAKDGGCGESETRADFRFAVDSSSMKHEMILRFEKKFEKKRRDTTLVVYDTIQFPLN